MDDGGDASSKLVLLDPNYPTSRIYAPDLQFDGEGRERFAVRHEIEPAPGRMMIFPSWLNHAVKPNKGPREPVSIAMNVMALPDRAAGS